MAVRKGLRIPKHMNTRLKMYALKHHTTRNALLTSIIADYANGQPVARRDESEPEREAIKVEVDPDVWEAAMLRAQTEGRPLVSVVQDEVERVLA